MQCWFVVLFVLVCVFVWLFGCLFGWFVCLLGLLVRLFVCLIVLLFVCQSVYFSKSRRFNLADTMTSSLIVQTACLFVCFLVCLLLFLLFFFLKLPFVLTTLVDGVSSLFAILRVKQHQNLFTNMLAQSI